jgi:hypothetical protein
MRQMTLAHQAEFQRYSKKTGREQFLAEMDAVMCGTAYNDKRQFTGVRVFVGDARDIKLTQRAPPDPFSAEAIAIPTIMGFRPKGRSGHRVKITGIVTHQETGHYFYIQNGGDGIRIATTDEQFVPVGARVEVIGFPALGVYSPELTNASFRVRGLGYRP